LLEKLLSSISIGKENLQWVGDRPVLVGEPHANQSRGGFLGTLELSGDLKPYLSLFYLGEWIHVGEANSFGQGWYRLEKS
jgi:hypothetical protein